MKLRSTNRCFDSLSFRGPVTLHSTPRLAMHLAMTRNAGNPVGHLCSRNARVGTGGELVRAPSRVKRRSTRWKRPSLDARSGDHPGRPLCPSLPADRAILLLQPPNIVFSSGPVFRETAKSAILATSDWRVDAWDRKKPKPWSSFGSSQMR